MMGQRGRGSVHAILHSAIYVCTGWRDHAVHTVSTKCVVCAHLIIDICRQFNVWFLAQISRHLMHLYYQHLATKLQWWRVLGNLMHTMSAHHRGSRTSPTRLHIAGTRNKVLRWKAWHKAWMGANKNGKVMNNVSQGRLCMHINTMCFLTCRTGGVTS